MAILLASAGMLAPGGVAAAQSRLSPTPPTRLPPAPANVPAKPARPQPAAGSLPRTGMDVGVEVLFGVVLLGAGVAIKIGVAEAF